MTPGGKPVRMHCENLGKDCSAGTYYVIVSGEQLYITPSKGALCFKRTVIFNLIIFLGASFSPIVF